MSMGNMAIARRSDVKAIILLGLALLSCVADGASRGHLFRAGARRVAETQRKIFDVTAFGAKTEGGQGKAGSIKLGTVRLDLPELPGGGKVTLPSLPGGGGGAESFDDEKVDEAGPGEGESPTEDNSSVSFMMKTKYRAFHFHLKYTFFVKHLKYTYV